VNLDFAKEHKDTEELKSLTLMKNAYFDNKADVEEKNESIAAKKRLIGKQHIYLYIYV
jgi:hypothetical protein